MIIESATGYMTTHESTHLNEYLTNQGYVALTEAVEVYFPDIPKKQLIAEKISSIDKAILYERQELNIKLKDLYERKAELLALEYTSDTKPEESLLPDMAAVNVEDIKTFYATIASHQKYKNTTGPGCVKLNALNESQARQLIHNATDGKWAFMYDSFEKVHELDRNILGTLGYLIPGVI